jgi:hypothetical protein
MDDIARFDHDFTPQQAGNFRPSLEAIPDGDYDWTILTASFDETPKEKKRILRLEVKCEQTTKVVEKVYFFESQQNVDVLGGDLSTLGFDVGEWKAPARPFSQEIHKAIAKLPGMRFRGTKKTNKQYPNLFITARLADATPAQRAVPSTNGTAANVNQADTIPF